MLRPSASVPKGVRHVWWNAGEEDLRTIIEFRPALRSEESFESYFALGKDGRSDPKTGRPNLLQTAVLLREFKDEIHLAKPPLFVQRIVFGTLALVGGMFGYGPRYPYPYPTRQEASPTAR